jgi:hypothetical protein
MSDIQNTTTAGAPDTHSPSPVVGCCCWHQPMHNRSAFAMTEWEYRHPVR